MNNNDTIVTETSRKSIARCNCPECKGNAGTATVCFNSRKLASRTAGNALVKAAGLLLLPACFFLPGRAQASPGQNDHASVGYLEVFSATEENSPAGVSDGDGYYLHTGYRIYDSTGKMVEWVENHDGGNNEDPQKVELAPGRYTIWAQSDEDGYVKVPVMVRPYQTALIHLEGNQEGIDPARAITTSSGKVVGRKAWFYASLNHGPRAPATPRAHLFYQARGRS